MEECGSRLGQDFVVVEKPAVDVRAPAARIGHPTADDEVAIDVNGPPVAHEYPRGHGRKAVPGGEQAARLVERGGDEAAVNEPRRRLVALVEPEPCVVLGRPLLARMRQVDSGWIAAAPAGWVVMRRDLAQRSPPWWKCALKKFSDPAVAIAAEAESSSASVAAATICAKR
jgi:hypothetical protein